MPALIPAAIWTHANVDEFKRAVRQAGPDGILKIESLSAATVGWRQSLSVVVMSCDLMRLPISLFPGFELVLLCGVCNHFFPK